MLPGPGERIVKDEIWEIGMMRYEPAGAARVRGEIVVELEEVSRMRRDVSGSAV